jgi:hypothetical protein
MTTTTPTPVRPRRAIPAPARVTPPQGWQTTIANDEIRSAIENYLRLQQELGERVKDLRAAESALDESASRDRDELADAIRRGTKRPSSDAHAQEAAAHLAEMRRLADATRLALTNASKDIVTAIEDYSDAVLKVLDAEQEKATKAAQKALAGLDDALARLAELRNARTWIATEGSRHTSGIVAGVKEWSSGRDGVQRLIAGPTDG